MGERGTGFVKKPMALRNFEDDERVNYKTRRKEARGAYGGDETIALNMY